ncbi:MAG: hypothetical protein ACJAXJ_002168 [Colwellia sp.]|jgi:hypothetical protein
MDLNHQMELMNVSMAAAVCSAVGCTWSQRIQDFGIDLQIHGDLWDLDPQINAQLKATTDFSIIKQKKGYIKYPLAAKNYRDLIKKTTNPRILILAILPKDPEQWVKQTDYQMTLQYGLYWFNLEGMAPTDNTDNKTITVPLENRFNNVALRSMMDQINECGGLCK